MRLTRDRVLFVTAILLSAWLVNRKPSYKEIRVGITPAYQQANKYVMTAADSLEGGFSNAVSYHYEKQAPRPIKALY